MSWLKALIAKLLGKKTDWDHMKYGNPPKESSDEQLKKLNGDL